MRYLGGISKKRNHKQVAKDKRR